MRIHYIECPNDDAPMEFDLSRDEKWICPKCGREIDPTDYSDGELVDMGAIVDTMDELSQAICNLKVMRYEMPNPFHGHLRALIEKGIACTELDTIRRVYRDIWELSDPDFPTGKFLQRFDLSYGWETPTT